MEEYNNWMIEEENGIFWAKLNRPEKMNAFNQEVAEELNKMIYKKIMNKKGWLTDEELNFLLMIHKQAKNRGMKYV